MENYTVLCAETNPDTLQPFERGYPVRLTNSGGWRAETRIPLGFITEGSDKGSERVLKITTSKNSRGGMWTCAGVSIVGESFERTAIFQDYFRTLRHIPCKRVTEKTIREAHEVSLKLYAVIAEAEANAQYKVAA